MKREKAILFTNIEYVTVNGVRTMCNALLLESVEMMPGAGARQQARGFGMDSTWPVFDVPLKTLDHSIEQTHPRGYDIKVGDVVFNVVTCNEQYPIEVEVFENFDYDAVWAALAQRTEQYWWAKGMPKLTWIMNPHPRQYYR